jgi:chromosome segregation ATPase
MSDRRAEVEKLKKSLEGLNTTTAQSRKKTAGLADDIEEQAKRYTEAKKASDDYKASQAAAANALVDYKEKTNDLKEKFKQLQASQDPEKTKALQLELAKLTKELNKIKKAAKEGIPPIDGFGDSQKKAAASVDGIKDRIKELTKEFNSLDQAQNPKKTAQLTFQLQQLNAEQKRLQDSIKGTNKSLGGINEAINFSRGFTQKNKAS